jgi:hypothetical protein
MPVPSSELGPPTTPSPASECVSPLDPSGESNTLAAKGRGGPNSDEGTETVVLYVLHCNISTTVARYIWLLFNDEAA